MECHGHFRTASCIRCHTQADSIQAVQRTIVEQQQVPYCAVPGCGGKIKPDIVFFGEGLPSRFHQLLPRDTAEVDCCLILGTSLQVAPVSSIPNLCVKQQSSSSSRSSYSNCLPCSNGSGSDDDDDTVCKRALLNREWVGDQHLPGFGGRPRRNNNNNNKHPRADHDVFHAGDCDDSVQLLAKILGWHDELQARYDALRM